MKLYKLTDLEGKTRGDTRWVLGKTVSLPPCRNPELCSSSVLHAYKDKHLGLLLNPYHNDFQKFQIWEVDGEVVVEDWGKAGCFELTPVRRIEIPEWYRKRREAVVINFGILCAKEVLPLFERAFPGVTGPRNAIEVAAGVLDNEYTLANADAAARIAEGNASDAHWASSYNSSYTSSEYAAKAAVLVAFSTSNAFMAAKYAPAAAARAARAAREVSIVIDFVKLAHQAVGD